MSIPERRHEVLAEILMGAVLTHDSGESARDAARRVATDRGTALGRATREQVRPGRLGAERALTVLRSLLAEQGFEPTRAAPDACACDCPFHPLAAAEPELVCGLNHAYLTGVLAGLEADTIDAVLAPKAGECCVELRSAT